ncbi:MAG: hypothetical protein ABSG37_09670 [Candidatus Limnocylindrales bacterium]
MKSLLSAAVRPDAAFRKSRRPSVRLLGLTPAALLLCGFFTAWAGPLAPPAAAVTPSGTVVAWGGNQDGQTTIPAGLSGVIAIAAGIYDSLALKSNGTVVAWGDNSYGQTTIPAGLSGVTAIAAGGYHNLALKSNGSVVAWGDNNAGQTTIPGGLSGVTAIAAGGSQSLALKSNGTVVAWGDNSYGQTTIPAGLSGVTAIAAGTFHNLALKSNGTVVAWGNNATGRTTIPAGLSGVIAIAAGYNSLALKSDGTVVAWGDNSFGQTTIPAGLSGVIAIAAGGFHNLALVAAPTVSPITGSTYHAISPARLLDTRSGNGLSGPFNANSPRTFGVTGRAGIPAGATAVTGNITAVDETAGWAVYLGPDPTASPGSSTINFGAGEVIGNGLTVALRADGTLSATYMSSSGNTTDLVFDVTGYFVPALWDM